MSSPSPCTNAEQTTMTTMTTFQITAKELLAAYIPYGEKRAWTTPYLCFLIKELAGWCPDDTDVINQFVLVKPERFNNDWSNSITRRMHKKYRDVRNPRLSLLKSIPPDHVFTFTKPHHVE